MMAGNYTIGDGPCDPGCSTSQTVPSEARPADHSTDEELRKAAASKQWSALLHQLSDHTHVDTVKHIVLMAASNSAWHFLVKFFKKGQDLCQTVYNCVLETLSVKHKSRFFAAVFKWVSTKQDVKIASNIFRCAIRSRSVRSKLAREIVFLVGNRPTPQFPKCRFDQLYSFFKAVQDFLAHDQSKEELNIFITALKEDGRDSCLYLACLLSALVGDWDFVNKCLLTESPQFYAGAKDVLCLAWENNALECAARVLQNTASKIWWLDPYLRPRDRKRTELFSSHPANSFDKQKMARYLAVCQDLKLYDAAMTICLLMKDMKGLLRVWFLMEQEEELERRWGSTVADLTKVVLEWSGWRLAMEMLACCDQNEQDDCLYVINSYMVQSQISDRKMRALAKPMISICSGPKAIQQTLAHIVVNCHSPSLLQKFFAREVSNISPADFYFGDRNLLRFIISEIQQEAEAFDYLRLHSFGRRLQGYAKELRDVRAMLRVAIETGVATHQLQPFTSTTRDITLPLTSAVKACLHEEAQLLYKAGAATNAEMYRLSTNLQLRADLERLGEKDLLCFIQDSVSTPRSLQKLCCLTVSHRIGCHTNRRHRALSLELPLFLIYEILLYDILYPDGNPWPSS